MKIKFKAGASLYGFSPGQSPAQSSSLRTIVKQSPAIIKAAFLATSLIFILSTCQKDYGRIMNIGRENIDSISATGFVADAEIIDVGESGIGIHGWCWAIQSNPDITDSKINLGTADKRGRFSCMVTGLMPNTNYYARAFASNGQETVYGEEKQINTQVLSFIILNPLELDVVGLGQRYQIEWDANTSDKLKMELYRNNATLTTIAAELAPNLSNFYWQVPEDLAEDNNYKIRISSVENPEVWAESPEFSLSFAAVPKVHTDEIDSISYFYARLKASIVNFGTESAAMQHGFCWGKTENPDINDSLIDFGTIAETQIFSTELFKLDDSCTYYVRAFATNSVGIAYGEQKEFTTLDATEPDVSTGSISDIDYYTAVGGGTILAENGTNVSVFGLCWNTMGNPTTEDEHSNETFKKNSFNDYQLASNKQLSAYFSNTKSTENYDFTSIMRDLQEDTIYYVKAYATNDMGTGYGAEISFATKDAIAPTIGSLLLSDITVMGLTCSATISSNNGSSITSRGFCWGKTENPDTTGYYSVDGIGEGEFSKVLSGLKDNTGYYIRAYATNNAGIAYSQQKSFTTLNGMPSLTTADTSNISYFSATCGGEVTAENGTPIILKGVCWATAQNPDITDDHSYNGSGIGAFTHNLTELTENTLYYVRAYAINHTDTAYGSQKSFTTTDATEATLTTAVPGNIDYFSATCGGEITDEGTHPVTERGVCWSTSPNPTIADTAISNGTGLGSYTCDITGLKDNTTYYVRAFATNAAGTSYGDPQTFTTNDATEASVTTADPTDISYFTATCGGEVTSEGTHVVTARGTCWASTTNPTLNDEYSADGSGVGTFTSSLTGLIDNTTYYFRAYAISAVDTVYGEQKSFTTLDATEPSLTTADIGNISYFAATGGGTISSDNGCAVTERGVCWGISANPDTTGAYSSDGSGTGTFTSTLIGLSDNTTYYVRAYAINCIGIAYGDEKSFTTLTTGTVSDYEGNTYKTVQIGTQTWMAENLRTTHYADGTILVDGSAAGDITGNYTTRYHFVYDNNNANATTYGKLYTWAAVMKGASTSNSNPSGVQGICPTGWHVPSDAEWTELTTYLGGAVIAGGKMKVAGFISWNSPNTGATNESGFNALASGYRNIGGSFVYLGEYNFLWSTTQYNSSYTYRRYLRYNYDDTNRNYSYKSNGFSVRCVQD